jgi:hypothetical protein
MVRMSVLLPAPSPTEGNAKRLEEQAKRIRNENGVSDHHSEEGGCDK